MTDHAHQPSMFGGEEMADTPDPKTLARRKDPGTSKEAAARVASFAGGHYEQIIGAMTALAKPVGAEQIAATLLRSGIKMDPYQIRKRLPELATRGKVRVAQDVLDDKVHDETRETSSGRRERLWVLVAG